MRSRILPEEEWSKLDVTKFTQIGKTMCPDDVQIVAVEDGNRLVATIAVLRVTHFESLWIDPEYRGNAGMTRRLLKEAFTAAKRWADKWVWGASDTDHMTDIIKRVGGLHLPLESFIIPLGGK